MSLNHLRKENDKIKMAHENISLDLPKTSFMQAIWDSVGIKNEYAKIF